MSIFKLVLFRSIRLQKSAKVQPAPAVPTSGTQPARSGHGSFDVQPDVVQIDQGTRPLAELERDAVIIREAAVAERGVEFPAGIVLRGAELGRANAKRKADMCSLLICFLGSGE